MDEYHLHPDNAVYSALSLGMGARPNALLFAITTAGTDTLSACMEQNHYVMDILNNEVDDPSYFGIIYTLDDENEIEDESAWIKANPNLGVSVDHDELRAQLTRAKNIGSTLHEVMTKRFNIWMQGEAQWIRPKDWQAAGRVLNIDDFQYKDCIVGLDLSEKLDITAICLLFFEGDQITIFGRYYIPKKAVNTPDNKNGAIYRKWIDQGYLIETPGEVIDYGIIKRDLFDLAEQFRIINLSYDPWHATQLIQELDAHGMTVEKVIQGFRTLSPACIEFQTFLARGSIQHDQNPVLSWAVSNVVLETDAAGNIKPDKSKSVNKIDPVSAMVNAFATYMNESEALQKIGDKPVAVISGLG